MTGKRSNLALLISLKIYPCLYYIVEVQLISRQIIFHGTFDSKKRMSKINTPTGKNGNSDRAIARYPRNAAASQATLRARTILGSLSMCRESGVKRTLI
jgi:hypothetical protein